MPALADRSTSDAGQGGKAAAGRWADLWLRTASAAVLAPAALACIWFGGTAWALLILMGAIGLMREWTQLCRSHRLAGLLALAVVGIATNFGLLNAPRAAAIALLGGAVVAGALGRSAVLAAGVLYIGIPMACLAWLRDGDGIAGVATVGRGDVMFVIMIVWASDIGAYIAGRLLGGPKLAPAISPGKTWSGALGGLVAAMLVGEAAAHWLDPTIPGTTISGNAALVAGVLGIASQAGDLLESWVKRRFGVKDSGRLIPGHGGLLDRLDGLLAAAVAATCIAAVAGRGGTLWN